MTEFIIMLILYMTTKISICYTFSRLWKC